MARKRRPSRRRKGNRRFRKRFVIAAEGTRTELEYFDIVEQWVDGVHLQLVPGSHSTNAPEAVLRRLRRGLDRRSLSGTDEAWVVVDRNGWEEADLVKLHKWSLAGDRCGLAVSNPNFEYWLLLHFEDGGDAATATRCRERLKRYLRNYDKRVPSGAIGLDQVGQAVARAKTRDNPPCRDWPRVAGSTVYRLVERILAG